MTVCSHASFNEKTVVNAGLPLIRRQPLDDRVAAPELPQFGASGDAIDTPAEHEQ